MITGLPEGIEINEYRVPAIGEWTWDGTTFRQTTEDPQRDYPQTGCLIAAALPGYVIRHKNDGSPWADVVKLYAAPERIIVLADSEDAAGALRRGVARMPGLTLEEK